jgi:hypothetical protein
MQLRAIDRIDVRRAHLEYINCQRLETPHDDRGRSPEGPLPPILLAISAIGGTMKQYVGLDGSREEISVRVTGVINGRDARSLLDGHLAVLPAVRLLWSISLGELEHGHRSAHRFIPQLRRNRFDPQQALRWTIGLRIGSWRIPRERCHALAQLSR